MTTPTAMPREKREREVILHRAAQSLDVKARTVRARISTPAPCRSYDWERGINLDEILDPEGCAPPKGDRVPLMDAHNRWAVDKILGTVSGIKAEDDEEFGRAVYADLRLADTEGGNLALKLIEQDHLTDVSVGYFPERSEFVEDGVEVEFLGRTVRGPASIVRQWSLIETSLVPVGADAHAKLRGAEGSKQRTTMADNITPTGAGGSAAPAAPAPSAPAEPKKERKAAKVVALKQHKEGVARAVTVERLRQARIRSTVEELGKSALVAGNATLISDLKAYGAKALEKGVVSKRAREHMLKLIEKGQRNVAPPSHLALGEEPGDTFHARAVDGMLLRAGRISEEKAHKGATEFANMRFLEMARHCLRQSGDRFFSGDDGATISRLAERAASSPRFMAQGAKTRSNYNHSSSDFPLILADAQNKILQQGYAEAPSTYQAWTRRAALTDLKSRKVYQLSNVPVPSIVNELGELPQVTVTEKGESYQPSTKGLLVGMSRTALINDDLDAFGRIPFSIGASFRRLINRTVYKLLLSNPEMAEDSVQLFHATHNNLSIGGAAVISVTSLGEAFAALATQKAPNSDADDAAYISAMARYLLVPPAEWVLADQVINSQVDPAKNNAASNPFTGRLQVIMEPELQNPSNTGSSAASWYVAADNASVDTIEVGFLNGIDAPVVEQEEGFTVLGLMMRAYNDFGVGLIDWRGLQKNAGA